MSLTIPAPARFSPVRAAIWLFPILAGASCASYPERQAGALDDLREGRLERSASTLEDNADGFLGAVEPGTVRFVGGDWAAAKADFLRAIDIMGDFEDRGVLGASNLLEGAGTLLFNESAAVYQGEGFEHVQVHAILALTFLAEGQLESALVEARRANRRLEREEELYEAKYAAGGLGHFVSALAYELRGELSDALIDYRRLDDKGLAPDLVGPELGRLASLLNREDLLPEYADRFGPAPQVPADSARVVLIAGVGLAPYKVEDSLRVVTPAGIVSWAVPRYQARSQAVPGVDLVIANHDQRVRSTVIEDVAQVAEKNLDHRLAWLAARSAARATSRVVVAKQLRDNEQWAASAVVDIFSLFAERADQRSWLTLPDTWQVAQAFVPAGDVQLAIDALGGATIDFGTISLRPGETAIVLARTVDSSLYAHLVGGSEPPAGSLESGNPTEPNSGISP